MHEDQLIRDALALPVNAIAYHVGQQLAARYPERALVEGGDRLFNIQEYGRAGQCVIHHDPVVYDQVMTQWRGREIAIAGMPMMMMRMAAMMSGGFADGQTAPGGDLVERSTNAWLRVEWSGRQFEVVVMTWFEQHGPMYHYWILADTCGSAHELVRAVSAWNAEIRGEVLVFDGGCWHKDANLFQAIKGATYENLVLRGTLKEDIFEDLTRFFASRELYDTYGIPWKRGIIFVGPPGNGKTHAVKAIINALDQPCLYVKSFRAEHTTEEGNIQQVFERARRSAPCVLVLEDLDALVNGQNRSFFLNELDGFAANVGVVTLATTNHPERLDPAIVDRPSRFDRKYPFDLPALAERLAYIRLWNATLKPALRTSEAGATAVAELTEGFSFAYLKELFLCSMMRWMADHDQGTMDGTMAGQVTVLRAQMLSAPPDEAEVADATPQGMLKAMMRRRGPGAGIFNIETIAVHAEE